MRNFIRNLHNKPDHHKQRFAMLASATVTLFIFGFWSIATFGSKGGVVADAGSQVASVSAAESEVSPFESIQSSVAGGLKAITEKFSDIMTNFNSVNFQQDYSEMKDKALDSYGQ